MNSDPREPCQRIRENIGTKQQSSLKWIRRILDTFHGTQCTAMFNLCLIECFLWEKEKHCSRWEQTQKGGDKAHELGSCPNFTSLQSWPPTTPRVIILMSKSKLGVFIYLCLWLLELPDDSGILQVTLQNIHLFADLWQHWDKTIKWNDNEKYYIYFHESYGNRCLKMAAKPLEDH